VIRGGLPASADVASADVASADVASADVASPAAADRRGPALWIQHLSKRFGDRTAFDDVTLEVGRGEVFGFLGPNGAGKTTTIRTLGTLIEPTSGSATVAGIPLTPGNGVEIRIGLGSHRLRLSRRSPGRGP
jgi:ABC-type Mn2+/Zn2+ transport system ATPase subunit